jgi:hypothetical protein
MNVMKIVFLAIFAVGWIAPSMAQSAQADSWNSLSFLEGSWEARTASDSAAKASGVYTFRRELGGHVMARHSNSAGCSAPTDFNCDHHDLLYIFQEAPGQALKAIYFDNEGHVIHYALSTPTPTSVVFLSDAGAGPQFRLSYELKDGIMIGKFQIHAGAEWKSYLEWSGAKVKQ